MTAPFPDAVLADVHARADELATLPAPERDRALKLRHKEEADVTVAGADLDDRQLHALVTDQVRLRRLRVLREEPGELTGAVERLRARDGARVAVLSGAGISVDAGFPTFRGEEEDSLWSQVDPMTLASTWGYAEDPVRTLTWYCWRRALGLPAVPTLAHAALARAQERLGDRWAGCHTQNVDGLHEAAGNRGVNRIHGSIWCWKDPRTLALSFDPSDRVEDVPTDADGRPLVRPGVVMFGDTVPTGVYERAIAETLRAEVALVVGTSAQVSTLWPLLHAAMQGGAQLVEINPEPSPVTHELGAIALPLPSGVGVPLALEAVGALASDDTEALARTPRAPLRDALPRLAAEFLTDR